MKIPSFIAFTLCCLFLFTSRMPAIDLEGRYMNIAFDATTGGITGITNPETGYNYISIPAKKPTLWRIMLKIANGEQVELSNTSCQPPTIKQVQKSVELLWNDVTIPGVKGGFNIRVHCSMLEVDHLSHFRFSVANNTDASILSTVFPEINGLGISGKSDVAFPKYNWGELHKGLKDKLTGNYPSADTPMQFCSLTDNDNSIYLAAHDPGAMYKTFLIQPGIIYSMETSVPNATVAGNDWNAPFDFVIGVYKGYWAASCKIYRQWVLKEAPWVARGSISKRKDISPAVKEIGVWLNLSENFAENEKNALEFQKQMGVPVGVHWYSWHSNPFDKDYPDYLPAKPGFIDTVKRLKDAGIYSMPYINGRLWDTQNKNYETAKPHATVNQMGEPNLEDYGSGTKLAVMCLGDPFWQDYLTQLIQRVADDTGVGGIYIDQVAGAPIAQCYSKEHGHTLGRGRWWIDGYRKSITAARDYCNKKPGGFFVAAENNAEPYMDFVDLFLIWIPRSQNDIPMMNMVYSGYTQYFGTNRAGDSDMSFAMLQARDFAWGAQLFWESAYVLKPEQKEKLKVLSNLATLRYKARKYMVEGELMGLVEPINSIPTVTAKWGSWTSTLEDRTIPAVHATLWKSGDGSYAVAIANADTKDQVFKFEFVRASVVDKEWTVQKMTSTGSADLDPVRKKSNILKVMVPARDGLVLVFK